MSKLNATPTGCPGPIPGTKVWRCDGMSCVYGASHYSSCKDEIAKRGYTLRISSDMTEEVAEAAELRRQNVQSQLAEEKAERIKEREQTQITLDNLTQNARNANAEAEEFANLYYEQMMFLSVANTELHTEIELNGSLMRTNADLNIDLKDSCEHCATLLQRIAELEDELLYYKQIVEAADVAEDTTGSTDTVDNCNNDSNMLDSVHIGGAVSD